MKSAEDWIEYWAHWLPPDERKVAALALKERDLENHRAGMTEAAEELNRRWGPDVGPEILMAHILNAREQRLRKSLERLCAACEQIGKFGIATEEARQALADAEKGES